MLLSDTELLSWSEHCKIFRILTPAGAAQGIFGLPKCTGANNTLCETMRSLLEIGAYLPLVQDRLVQAQYWHDPESEDRFVKGNVFLPGINGEVVPRNPKFAQRLMARESLHPLSHTHSLSLALQTSRPGVYLACYCAAFCVTHRTPSLAKGLPSSPLCLTLACAVKKFVMVKFTDDTVVVPRESEWFGFYGKTGKTIVLLEESPMYTEDWLGLKAMNEVAVPSAQCTPLTNVMFLLSRVSDLSGIESALQGGKLIFLESPGDHLAMPKGWFEKNILPVLGE